MRATPTLLSPYPMAFMAAMMRAREGRESMPPQDPALRQDFNNVVGEQEAGGQDCC
jgi:hypothetical protein